MAPEEGPPMAAEDMVVQEDKLVCANPNCVCEVRDDGLLPRAETGKIYCSEGCRRGVGCGHRNCACLERAVA